jgi:hypothetical protein
MVGDSAHSAAKALPALLGPGGSGGSRRGLADGDVPPPLSTTGPGRISPAPMTVIPLGELESHGKKEKENPISLAILQINH